MFVELTRVEDDKTVTVNLSQVVLVEATGGNSLGATLHLPRGGYIRVHETVATVLSYTTTQKLPKLETKTK